MVIQTLSSEDAASNATPSNNDGIEIKEPHEHDVLCGRGGSINAWKGNERFRTLIEKRKRVYLTARFKREKRLIASSIVQEIQALKPPGRFLAKHAKKGTWFVIDDEKARDKVSQALRENAPSIRAEIETENTETRSEIQRAAPHPPPPPPSAPPNPYYPPQGWGYFSYYGYAQQSPPHTGGPMPMPPPPPPAYYPGYHVEQWNAASNVALPQNQQQPPPQPQALAPAPSPPVPKPQHPPQQQQSAFNFSFAPKVSPMPPPQAQIQQPRNPAQPKPQPKSPPRQPRQQLQQQSNHHQLQQQDDDRSIFDAAAQSIFNSMASWTKDAFSLGGDMSISSNHDDQRETESIASKPIKYMHQPDDEKSVGSRAPSVHFKDERSISGRSLDNNRKPGRPPRIMHSSQISYPRRLKRRSSLGSSGQPNSRIPLSNAHNPMAPMSSVNLDGHNDGMISLITTEGINSIVEEGSIMMDDYQPAMEQTHPNEEYKENDPVPSTMGRRSKFRNGLGGEDASSSMLTSVANQLVTGLESWDASIACGPESAANRGIPNEITKLPDTMAFEIEGQEVQLVDMMEAQLALGDDDIVLEQRLPHHEKDRLLDWPSRVGSCHSFLNDSLSMAGTSFFSNGYNSRGDSISPASSIDMDVSSGTDPFSFAGGSVGGASLCRVFDADGVAQDAVAHALPSPRLHNRILNQVSSWERNLQSKSPLSIGSHSQDDDHGSMFTRSSEKLAGGSISTIGSAERSKSSSE